MTQDHQYPKTATSFRDLKEGRRKAGFEEYAIVVGGERVDKALFMDTSWETLEEISDSIIYLEFELVKLEALGIRNEARRIKSYIRQLWSVGDAIWIYRERIKSVAPDLLKEKEVSK